MKSVKILGVAGSPRKKGNTAKLVQKALDGAKSVLGVKTELYEMAGKNIHHCIGCHKCLDTGECTFKDDFQIFIKKYLDADGVLLGSPVYHMAVPASMKAALDRLANVIICNSVMQGKNMPIFNKVCGVLTGGLARFGGQEMTLNFLINSSLLMNGIVVSGNTMLGDYIGVASHLPIPEKLSRAERAKSKNIIIEDDKAMTGAELLGKRIAEVTKIVKIGLTTLKKELPSDYFYTSNEKYCNS
jgi:multimeric flavodoxin WrbA